MRVVRFCKNLWLRLPLNWGYVKLSGFRSCPYKWWVSEAWWNIMQNVQNDTEVTPKLVWLDLETTGLVPENGHVLEVGVVVTELDLTELGRASWVFPHVRQDVLTSMNDYVLEMHVASGLLREVWFTAAPNVSTDYQREQARRARESVWDEVVEWVRGVADVDVDEKLRHLAGSSIHFDRAWLRVHCPRLLRDVSHRMLDVSSYKVAFPDLLKQPEGEPAHRALDDLDYSIDQHRQVLELLEGK